MQVGACARAVVHVVMEVIRCRASRSRLEDACLVHREIPATWTTKFTAGSTNFVTRNNAVHLCSWRDTDSPRRHVLSLAIQL